MPIAEPTPPSIDKPVSADSLFQNNEPLRLTVHPKNNIEPTAPSVEKPVSADKIFDMNKPVEPTVPKYAAALPGRIGENFKEENINHENKYLGSIQKTSPYHHQYGDPLGEAQQDEADTVGYKDDKDQLQPTDTSKHVVMRDPKSGKYMVYARSKETDENAESGIGRLAGFVQEGAATDMGRPRDLIRSATKGQQALKAAHRVEQTTGETVPISRAAVTENPALNIAARTSSVLPGGSGPFANAAARTEHGIESAANSAASMNTGVAADAAHAGEAAKSGLEEYVKPKGVLAGRVSKAYDKLDPLIDNTKPHPVSNTMKAAQDIQSSYEATKQEGFAPSIKKVMGAVTDPHGVTYSGLKDLRTQVGELIDTGAKAAETGMHEIDLKYLYKSLTDDMKDLVQTHGGARGMQLWERANNYARLASDRRKVLGKILGAKTKSDEAVFGSLLKKAGSTVDANIKALNTARKSMPPDQWDEVASGVVSRLGRRVTNAGAEFDPGKFVRDYASLSSQGKNVLFGENVRLRKALDAISDVSHTWDDISRKSHGGGAIAHTIGTVAAVEHGGLLHAVAIATGLNTLSRLLARPATAESVARWMQGYKVLTLKPTKANMVVFNQAAKALSDNVDHESRGSTSKAGSHIIDASKKLVEHLSPFGGK